jgi:hypothetical protein
LILEFPNYLSAETVKVIKETVKSFTPQKKQARYNREGNTVLITFIPELKELDSKLHKIFIKIQADIVQPKYKPTFESADAGYEYHIYHPKDVCHPHVDGEMHRAQDNITLLRYASVILHLNTVYEGGELVFPEQNVKIKTEEGKLVIFPPYGMYSHYTTPSNEPREVIVTWFVYNNVNVITTNI